VEEDAQAVARDYGDRIANSAGMALLWNIPPGVLEARFRQ